jgi:hypothetical protein
VLSRIFAARGARSEDRARQVASATTWIPHLALIVIGANDLTHEAMTAEWDPSNYRDTYRERVEELIEAKKNNEEIVMEEQAQPQGKSSTCSRRCRRRWTRPVVTSRGTPGKSRRCTPARQRPAI